MIETALPSPPADSSDKLLAILCHLSFFLGVGFLLPLIVYFVKKNESSFLRIHAGEVLNFHISLIIYCLCAAVLIFVLIGIPILMLIGVMAVICAIIGAIKASRSEYYFYPLTIRFFS